MTEVEESVRSTLDWVVYVTKDTGKGRRPVFAGLLTYFQGKDGF